MCMEHIFFMGIKYDYVQSTITPGFEGKPNANHVRVRISNSRTQRLHKLLIIAQCFELQ